jgi:hypothetical protein
LITITNARFGVDAPKARALALKRLSPEAQGYLESLCE